MAGHSGNHDRTIVDPCCRTTNAQVSAEPTPGLEPGTCRLQVGCAARLRHAGGCPHAIRPPATAPSAGFGQPSGHEVALDLAPYPLQGVVHRLRVPLQAVGDLLLAATFHVQREDLCL
jgi:hypothetical protein